MCENKQIDWKSNRIGDILDPLGGRFDRPRRTAIRLENQSNSIDSTCPWMAFRTTKSIGKPIDWAISGKPSENSQNRSIALQTKSNLANPRSRKWRHAEHRQIDCKTNRFGETQEMMEIAWSLYKPNRIWWLWGTAESVQIAWKTNRFEQNTCAHGIPVNRSIALQNQANRLTLADASDGRKSSNRLENQSIERKQAFR